MSIKGVKGIKSGKFKFKKYDPVSNDVIHTNVPPNSDGSDIDLYLKPTGLKDSSGKNIYNLDIIEQTNDLIDGDKNNKGVVISNLKVCDDNGNDKLINVVIFDNGAEILDDNNAGDYTVIGDVSSTPHLLK